MARRRTLGKQYYKNRQKNYNISKIKRVKRIKTKTRKLGGGLLLSSLRRTRIVPFSYRESQKEALRNHKLHMDEHIEIMKKTVSEIEELYNNHKKFFSTLEYFNKDYVRFIVNTIKPKLDVSPDTYRDIDIDRGDILKNSYVLTFMEIWKNAEEFEAHVRGLINPRDKLRRGDIVFSKAEEEVLSEISRLLNIIRDNSNALGYSSVFDNTRRSWLLY